MDNEQRLQLKKLMDNNEDFQETTAKIRDLKHSDRIRYEVKELIMLKSKYSRLASSNPGQFARMCESKCQFLYMHYTEIYNKVRKDELDLAILDSFLSILKQIENGELDQHEGSFKVGEILKRMYVDSALKRDAHNSRNHKKKSEFKRERKITWGEYKKQRIE